MKFELWFVICLYLIMTIKIYCRLLWNLKLGNVGPMITAIVQKYWCPFARFLLILECIFIYFLFYFFIGRKRVILGPKMRPKIWTLVTLGHLHIKVSIVKRQIHIKVSIVKTNVLTKWINDYYFSKTNLCCLSCYVGV